MNNQDYTKCFICANRNSNGFCGVTACVYIPIQTQTTNEINQQNLITPCPISNNIKEVKDD